MGAARRGNDRFQEAGRARRRDSAAGEYLLQADHGPSGGGDSGLLGGILEQVVPTRPIARSGTIPGAGPPRKALRQAALDGRSAGSARPVYGRAQNPAARAHGAESGVLPENSGPGNPVALVSRIKGSLLR